MPHIPVLYQQVLAGLQVKPGGQYIDATLGAGGHAAGILLASAPDGRVLGIDADPAALAIAGERLAEDSQRTILVRGNFADLTEIATRHGFHLVDGVLFDLGLSSMHLEAAERGFSFQRDGPLDMRFDPALETTAADLVNRLSGAELADLLFRYGEEPLGRRIARAIVQARPIQTTLQLAEVVERATRPSRGRRRRRIHPATKTFQALRIAVNNELPALETALSQALNLLAPDGRLLVISFHSLEDRLVKTFFRQESRDCICPSELPTCLCRHRASLEILTKKPIRPSEREIEANRRSRSAKLRIARRL